MKEKTDLVLCEGEVFDEPQAVAKTENNENAVECHFLMTYDNHRKLAAMKKYAMFLEVATDSRDEPLSIDGIINTIIAEGITRSLKEIAKKHGFYDVTEFVEIMADCTDGEKAFMMIQYKERKYMERTMGVIKANTPVEDKQKDLPFDAK